MAAAIVVKIGGSTLGSHDTTLEDIVTLQKQGRAVVVVHGGGKLITDWLKKQGVASRFVQGERVTDGPTLEVVTSVLAGLVNKDIVSALNSRGGRAAGISGVDGALIEGRIAEREKGYVGAVSRVNTGIVDSLMTAGFVPVIAPIGLNTDGRAPGEPATLNFNADTIAGEVAAAIGAERLVFLTDVAGILDKSGALLPRLTSAEAQAMVTSGVASGGMIPKVRACLRALDGGGTTCIVDGREPHALVRSLAATVVGTTIEAR